MPRCNPMMPTRTFSNGWVFRSWTGSCPAGRGRVTLTSPLMTIPLGNVTASVAVSWATALVVEMRAAETPKPASADAFRKSRREEFEVFIVQIFYPTAFHPLNFLPDPCQWQVSIQILPGEFLNRGICGIRQQSGLFGYFAVDPVFWLAVCAS